MVFSEPGLHLTLFSFRNFPARGAKSRPGTGFSDVSDKGRDRSGNYASGPGHRPPPGPGPFLGVTLSVTDRVIASVLTVEHVG